MLYRLAAVSLTVAAVAVAGAMPAQAQQVKSGDEIKAIFAGNSADITHRNGRTQKAYFQPDGVGKITERDKVRAGKWTIESDTICHDLSDVRKCYRVFKKGDNKYELESTDFAYKPTYVMVPGNPNGF